MAVLCFGVIAVIFFGDQWIKNYIERTREMGVTAPKCGGRLLIRRTHNSGAVMNLGQGRRKLIAALSVAMTVLALACFLISLGQKGNRFLRIGLAALLGGAFSNTYDRLKRKYVVDYFSFGVRWKGLRDVVFNLADFCILIGALVAAFGALD